MTTLARALFLAAIATAASAIHAQQPGQHVPRTGDEIMVCGQLFHTTAPVVLWIDAGGYDAYRVERRFSEFDKSSWADSTKENTHLTTPNRYGLRKEALTPEEIERVRGGGWDLPTLKKVVDQFVLHYDVCGTSGKCFQVLHDARGLSVHFMLDVDGTIYQTLDLKERAWHATISNTRSVGVEIANIGAYPVDRREVLEKWYAVDSDGAISLLPSRTVGRFGVRSKPFLGQPDRQELIEGKVQGTQLAQYDYTPQQYDSLIKLTATLCRVFPKLRCAYPTDDAGKLIPKMLPPEEWREFQGVLGHYHVQKNKVDPGPALQWEKLINGARDLLE
ncbi:peptidoglycan recognition family protein [Pirellulales bacterium]|nr:peptidoglycan recognition family protein [Pirellulales bacterium]